MNIVERGPDSTYHKANTFSSNPSLDTIPDTSHCCSVEHRPKSAPDSEGRSSDDGEGNVISGTDSTCKTDEAGGNSVSKPDTDP